MDFVPSLQTAQHTVVFASPPTDVQPGGRNGIAVQKRGVDIDRDGWRKLDLRPAGWGPGLRSDGNDLIHHLDDVALIELHQNLACQGSLSAHVHALTLDHGGLQRPKRR